MITAARFDELHGKGAFVKLRLLLGDPVLSYERIGGTFGLTRQRIAQLAEQFGIDVKKRLRERRRLRRPRAVIVRPYPPGVAAVIKKMKQSGVQVRPYNARLACEENRYRRSQTKVLVNGALCVIQLRPARRVTPTSERQYARFDVGQETRRVQAAIFAMQKGPRKKLYVVPTAHLRKLSAVYIPATGKYAAGRGKESRRDWTRYENAWHLLGLCSTGRLASRSGLAI